MPDQNSPERPWTEAQWEAFFRRNELRSMRFGDLLETLHDHPDRDELIASEMGWDVGESSLEVEAVTTDEWLGAAMQLRTDDEPRKPLDLSDSPVHTEALEWGMKLLELGGEIGRRRGAESEENRETLEKLSQGGAVGPRLAGGAVMGQDEEMLCAEIVCCRQAQQMAEQAIAALRMLAGRGVVAAGRAETLVQDGERVCGLIAARVAELRARVWWEG